MGWVLFSFHLQRSYSLVVSNERATLYLVRIFSAARCAGFRQKKSPGRVGRCQIQHGAMPGRVGGKTRKKLCASVTSISLVVFKPTSNIILGVEIERALRGDSAR